MSRRSTGAVVEVPTRDGTSFAIRFRALGKRQYLTLGHQQDGWTRKLAQDELQNVLADVRRGIWQPPEAIKPQAVTDPLFADFAREWLDRQCVEGGRRGTGLSPNGEAALRWVVEKHLIPRLGHRRLSEITVQVVDDYRLAKVREKALSASSINKCLAVLAQILEQAMEWQLIERNPARGRKRRLAADPPKRTSIDRADHIQALLDAAGQLDAGARTNRGQRRALVALLVFAGLRISEALALRWGDIDVTRRSADGRTHGTITIRAGKTVAAERVVDVLPPLREELVAYKAGVRDAPPSAHVFATSAGTPLSAHNARKRVVIAAAEMASERLVQAGMPPLPDRITPHSLRRTFCSLLIAAGEDPGYVMDQMGHEDPDFTMGVYRRAMLRRDGERDRLRALVYGQDGQTTGISDLDGVPTLVTSGVTAAS